MPRPEGWCCRIWDAEKKLMCGHWDRTPNRLPAKTNSCAACVGLACRGTRSCDRQPQVRSTSLLQSRGILCHAEMVLSAQIVAVSSSMHRQHGPISRQLVRTLTLRMQGISFWELASTCALLELPLPLECWNSFNYHAFHLHPLAECSQHLYQLARSGFQCQL